MIFHTGTDCSGDTIPAVEGGGGGGDGVWELSPLMTLAVKSGRKEQEHVVGDASRNPVWVRNTVVSAFWPDGHRPPLLFLSRGKFWFFFF